MLIGDGEFYDPLTNAKPDFSMQSGVKIFYAECVAALYIDR